MGHQAGIYKRVVEKKSDESQAAHEGSLMKSGFTSLYDGDGVVVGTPAPPGPLNTPR